MSREGKLGRGVKMRMRRVAAGLGGQQEDGLRELQLAGDGLHRRARRASRPSAEHRQLVPLQWPIGEDVEQHVATPRLTVRTGRTLPIARSRGSSLQVDEREARAADVDPARARRVRPRAAPPRSRRPPPPRGVRAGSKRTLAPSLISSAVTAVAATGTPEHLAPARGDRGRVGDRDRHADQPARAPQCPCGRSSRGRPSATCRTAASCRATRSRRAGRPGACACRRCPAGRCRQTVRTPTALGAPPRALQVLEVEQRHVPAVAAGALELSSRRCPGTGRRDDLEEAVADREHDVGQAELGDAGVAERARRGRARPAAARRRARARSRRARPGGVLSTGPA